MDMTTYSVPSVQWTCLFLCDSTSALKLLHMEGFLLKEWTSTVSVNVLGECMALLT